MSGWWIIYALLTGFTLGTIFGVWLHKKGGAAMTTAYTPPFPTDEMTLRLLIEACSMNEELGQTNLMAFLEMGAEIATEEWIEPDVVERTYVEGKEPYSPQHVIDTLARELLRRMGEQP